MAMLKSGRARHEQISDWLREQIEDGAYKTDDQLPSENDLCKQFDVSRITIRRALQTLESEDLIYRKQGLGSFVQNKPMRQGLVYLTDFVEDMATAGLEASSVVTHQGFELPPTYVAQILGVRSEVPVMRLDRLRLGNGQPIAFDRTWMPNFYAQLIQEHDLEHETIYHILEKEYDIPVVSGRYRIEAINAPADVAQHLNVRKGTALLQIDRLSKSVGNKPIFFQRRLYRSDKVAYELELERDGRHGTEQAWPLRDFEPVFKSDTES